VGPIITAIIFIVLASITYFSFLTVNTSNPLFEAPQIRIPIAPGPEFPQLVI
jgi:hypothetical protein